MQFSQEHNHIAFVIKSYDDTSVKVIQPVTAELVELGGNEPDKINELRFLNLTRSLIIAIDRLQQDWSPRTVQELDQTHIKEVLNFHPEIVILGTGSRLTWPHPQVMKPLIENGVGYEVMTHGSACRTYNVLMHEGRRAVLALLL